MLVKFLKFRHKEEVLSVHDNDTGNDFLCIILCYNTVDKCFKRSEKERFWSFNFILKLSVDYDSKINTFSNMQELRKYVLCSIISGKKKTTWRYTPEKLKMRLEVIRFKK